MTSKRRTPPKAKPKAANATTPARLVEITIGGIRGFRAEQTLSTDADIIVVAGANGLGKSSLLEGLDLLLNGIDSPRERRHLIHREESRGRIRATYRTASAAEAIAELVVVAAGDGVQEASRTGPKPDTHLAWLTSCRGEDIGDDRWQGRLLRLLEADRDDGGVHRIFDHLKTARNLLQRAVDERTRRAESTVPLAERRRAAVAALREAWPSDVPALPTSLAKRLVDDAEPSASVVAALLRAKEKLRTKEGAAAKSTSSKSSQAPPPLATVLDQLAEAIDTHAGKTSERPNTRAAKDADTESLATAVTTLEALGITSLRRLGDLEDLVPTNRAHPTEAAIDPTRDGSRHLVRAIDDVRSGLAEQDARAAAARAALARFEADPETASLGQILTALEARPTSWLADQGDTPLPSPVAEFLTRIEAASRGDVSTLAHSYQAWVQSLRAAAEAGRALTHERNLLRRLEALEVIAPKLRRSRASLATSTSLVELFPAEKLHRATNSHEELARFAALLRAWQLVESDALLSSEARRSSPSDLLSIALDAVSRELEGRGELAQHLRLPEALLEVCSAAVADFLTAFDTTVAPALCHGDQALIVHDRENGLPFAGFSTGQKNQVFLSTLLAFNGLLEETLGHRVLLLDDVTFGLDLGQIPRLATLLRRCAYGPEFDPPANDSPTRRQIFVTSHQEEMTHRLIDALLPPFGRRLLVIDFVGRSAEKGPDCIVSEPVQNEGITAEFFAKEFRAAVDLEAGWSGGNR